MTLLRSPGGFKGKVKSVGLEPRDAKDELALGEGGNEFSCDMSFVYQPEYEYFTGLHSLFCFSKFAH